MRYKWDKISSETDRVLAATKREPSKRIILIKPENSLSSSLNSRILVKNKMKGKKRKRKGQKENKMCEIKERENG